jgi:hypothetical protein
LQHASRQTCRDCNAWVDIGATHCALCGIVLPTARPWTFFGRRWSQAHLGGALGAVGGAVVGTLLGLSYPDASSAQGFVQIGRWIAPVGLGTFAATLGWALDRWPGLVRASLVGIVCGWLFGLPEAIYHPWTLGFGLGLGVLGSLGVLGGRWLDRTFEARDPRCVQTLRQTTQARLTRLQADAQRMAALRQQIAEDVAPQHQAQALFALDAAAQATDRQRQRDEVALWRLDLVDWQNPLQPIQAGWRQASVQACEQHLRTLQEAERDGSRLLERWQQDPLAESDGGRRVVVSLRQLLVAVERLREAVVLRETAALAAGSPGVREAFSGPELPAEAVRQIELLRERPELVELGVGMEDEAARLLAEHLAVLEVERLVS